jgi:hypothetical protein
MRQPLLGLALMLAAVGCSDHPTGGRESGGPVPEEAIVETRDVAINEELAAFIAGRLSELGEIDDPRRQKLGAIAGFVSSKVREGLPARLTFICTHNSRRSHMSQLWAQTAAHYFSVPGVESYSGGTEATAFNPRAVAALGRAGFLIDRVEDGDNPVYEVRFRPEMDPMRAFSKVYDQPPNPTQGFAAVMTCSAADAACPIVFGAEQRIAIPYDDPKAFDDTVQEAAKYDERCRQIAREMLYLFSTVAARS